MKTNAEPLDGFERKLLTKLLALDDDRRDATSAFPPPPRRGPVRRRTIAVLTGVLAAGALTAAAVSVLTDPESFQPAGEAVVRGEEILVKGSGCGPNEPISFRLDGDTLATARAASNGTFIEPVRIPSSTVPGMHRLTASCSRGDGSTLTKDAAIEVLPFAEPLGASLAIGGGVPAGGSVIAKGSGCAASTEVTLAIEGADGVAHATAGSDGAFFAEVAVPASTEPGTYRTTATCTGANGEPLVQQTELSVLAATAEPPAQDKAKRAPG